MQDARYYHHPDERSFDATVTGCRDYKDGLFAVTLSDTLFYPEGGGQPGDTGTLSGVRVTDTRLSGDEIVHVCEAELPVGQTVHGELDWERRFRHMQCHTGEHIFSGIAHELYGCNNVGFHLSRDCVTIDFDRVLTAEQLAEVERQTNEAVFADVPTIISYPDADTLRTLDYRSKKELTGTVRIVEAGGRDVCACCGLHVARSGMVGCVKVGTQTPHRGGIRLTLLIGWDAVRDYDQKQKSVTEISHILSAKPHEVAQAVELMASRNDRYKAEVIALHEQIFRLNAALLPSDQDRLWSFAENLSPVQIRQFADILAEQTGWAAVFSEAPNGGYQYAICGHNVDVRPICKELNQALNGHGGGKPAVVQGAVQASQSEIETFFRNLSIDLRTQH
ncbi:MAG TPA: alanyl-tRNA editing protein [Butyricicoccus pullicaecorum]|nr:alanyl-tRNA editing protein [Butyricicoccus pullicaecorum]